MSGQTNTNTRFATKISKVAKQMHTTAPRTLPRLFLRATSSPAAALPTLPAKQSKSTTPQPIKPSNEKKVAEPAVGVAEYVLR